MRPAAIEGRAAFKNESEGQLPVVRIQAKRATGASHRSNVGKIIGGLRYAGFLRLAPAEGRPGRSCRDMHQEELPGPFSRWIASAVGQLQLVIGVRRMGRRAADLDDLQARRAFENAMPDLRRLQH